MADLAFRFLVDPRVDPRNRIVSCKVESGQLRVVDVPKFGSAFRTHLYTVAAPERVRAYDLQMLAPVEQGSQPDDCEICIDGVKACNFEGLRHALASFSGRNFVDHR
jgi:hypothetical protein